jgi:hypothetical protein
VWLFLITGRSLCVVHDETRFLIMAKQEKRGNGVHVHVPTSGSSSFRAEMADSISPLWMECMMDCRAWMEASGCCGWRLASLQNLAAALG